MQNIQVNIINFILKNMLNCAYLHVNIINSLVKKLSKNKKASTLIKIIKYRIKIVSKLIIK